MAAADKCHLNIPDKNYLRALVESGDKDGKIDKDALMRAAAAEFENYKAIERRINNPACSTSTPIASVSLLYGDDVNVTVGGGGGSGQVHLTGWAQRANGGSGSSWPLTSDYLTVPEGSYLVSAWCEVFGPALSNATDVEGVELRIRGPLDAVIQSMPYRQDDPRTFWLSCSGPVTVPPGGGDIDLVMQVQGTPAYTFVAESNRMLTVVAIGSVAEAI